MTYKLTTVKLTKISLLFFGVILSARMPLAAANISWNASEGLWNDTLNWSPSVLPSAADSATISNGGSAKLDDGSSGAAKTLNIGSAGGSYLDILNGTLNIGSATETYALYMSSNAADISHITVGGTEDAFGTLNLAHKSQGSSSTYVSALGIGVSGTAKMDVVGYGQVEIKGNLTLGGRTADSMGTLNLSDNAVVTIAEYGKSLNIGFTGSGYLNMSGNAKFNAIGDTQSTFFVGGEESGYGEINMSGNSELYASWGIQVGWYGDGRVILNDNAKIHARRNISLGTYGNAYMELNDNAYVRTINNMSIGAYSGSDSSLVMNGGEFLLEVDGGAGYGFLIVGQDGKGSLTVNDGLLTVANAIYTGYNAGSDGTVNLNGGVVITRGVLGSEGASVLNINGGTLKAAATSYTSFINNIKTVNLLSGGLTIDTSGQTLRINSSMTGEGGLTKIGEGLLYLTKANTISGDININAGGLVADELNALGSGTVYVNNATFLASTVEAANAGSIVLNGGDLMINQTGDYTGILNLSGDFELNAGTYFLTINSTSDFDKIVGNGPESYFLLDAGIIDLSGSIIDYYASYLVFENFAEGFVYEDNLSITGYDTDNWVAHINTEGVLYFDAVPVPEPGTWAAIFGAAALACAAYRRKVK